MVYEMEPPVEYYYHIDPEGAAGTTAEGATEELLAIKRPEEEGVEGEEAPAPPLVIKRPDEEGVEYILEDNDQSGIGVGLVDCGDGTYTYYPLAAEEDTTEDVSSSAAAAATYLIDPSVIIAGAGEDVADETGQVQYTYVYHNEDETDNGGEDVAIQME